jgi:hypothetical protein
MTQDVLNQITAISQATTGLQSKVKTAIADPEEKQAVLTQLAEKLNSQVFPGFKSMLNFETTELDPWLIKAIEQMSEFLSESATPENSLSLLKQLSDACLSPLYQQARINGYKKAADLLPRIGICIDDSGREYNLAGSLEKDGKTLILLSPPNIELVNSEGYVAKHVNETSLIWQQRLLAVLYDNNTGKVEISSTPSMNGKFVTESQVYSFNGRNSQLIGTGEIVDAWVLRAIDPDSTNSFPLRAGIVRGFDADISKAFGTKPVYSAISAETPNLSNEIEIK